MTRPSSRRVAGRHSGSDLLQQLCESGRTRAGDVHARRGGCHTPVRLPRGVTYHGVDGYDAEKKYLDEVVGLDLHAITKLRSYADCDSQQFTGLLDCQARAESASDFHFNASLATLNLVRAEDLGIQHGQEPQVFSMASWKPCQFNERLLELFMEQ